MDFTKECLCVCVCVCVREGSKKREKDLLYLIYLTISVPCSLLTVLTGRES